MFDPARITDRIYQNGYISINWAFDLKAKGITHILNLDLPYRATNQDFSNTGLAVTEFMILDRKTMTIEQAIKIVDIIHQSLASAEHKIYVHCNAGLSRSPTAVWLYLLSIGWSEDRAGKAIAAAAEHLSAPDPILIHGLDLSRIIKRHAENQ